VLENICQTVLAFRSNFFGAITHRGGRDARVPVRAASRQLSATPMGDGLEQQDSRTRCRLNADAIHQESPAVDCPPYDHQRKKNLCGITRALPYAMIFCPFKVLMQRIDTAY
jgi:hypothetical protein